MKCGAGALSRCNMSSWASNECRRIQPRRTKQHASVFFFFFLPSVASMTTRRGSLTTKLNSFNYNFEDLTCLTAKSENSLDIQTITRAMKRDEGRRLSQRDRLSRQQPRHTFAFIALFNQHLDAPPTSSQ